MPKNVTYTPAQEKHIKKTFGHFEYHVDSHMGGHDARDLRKALRHEAKIRSSLTLAKVILMRVAIESFKGAVHVKDLWGKTEGQQRAAIIGSALLDKGGSLLGELHEAMLLAIKMHDEAHDAYIRREDD